jgi:TolB-like protein/Tfp pilus assembly protein PilF
MPKDQNILIRFWQELKRRKVFKVLAMYAGSAFVIIQVIDILTNRLNLPPWIATIVIIILSIGFPVTAILAWIFDLTPEGIKKTQPIEQLAGKETITPPSRRRLKASDIAIAVLAIAVIILAWPKIFKPDSLKRLRSSGEKLSVAVMPFKNMTNDTTWNVWQNGIQQSLISSLSNTGELKVRPQESTNKLLQPGGVTEYASISPALAGSVSRKLDADFFIYGSLIQAGTRIRIDAQLIDTKTKEVFKAFKQEGESSDKYVFQIIDSLSKKLTDFLIISKLIKGNPVYGFGYPGTTKSPEAFRYNIYGMKAFAKMDYPTARSWFLKALEIDTNYYDPLSYLAYAYGNVGMWDKYIPLVLKIYNKRDQWPPAERMYAEEMYATEFEPLDVTIRYAKQIKEMDGMPSYFLGLCYMVTNQYDKAISEWEELLKISRKWGREFLKESWVYNALGEAYHKTGQYKKERKLYKEAERVNDDHKSMYFSAILKRQAILAFTKGDSISANNYLTKFIAILKENSFSEAVIADNLGWIFSDAKVLDKAEEKLRQALSLEPENPGRLNNLAWFFFINERNISEGLSLIDKALALDTGNYMFLDTKGWGLYKQGKNMEALEFLEKSDSITKPRYRYINKNHIEEVKKAIAAQK